MLLEVKESRSALCSVISVAPGGAKTALKTSVLLLVGSMDAPLSKNLLFFKNTAG